MKIHRTIRYRLHPKTKAESDKSFAPAGVCRFVWNRFAGKLQRDCKFHGSCNPCFKRGVSIPLETVCKEFCKGESGLPKFKGGYGS